MINGFLHVGGDETRSWDERVSVPGCHAVVEAVSQQSEERDNRELFHLKVGHTAAKEQNQCTGNNQQNSQRSNCRGEAHEGAILLHPRHKYGDAS